MSLRLTSQNLGLANRVFDSLDAFVSDELVLRDGIHGLFAYAHRPFDDRSAAIGIVPESDDPTREITACREVGAPLIVIAGKQNWQLWRQPAVGAPQRIHPYTLKIRDVENYFVREKARLNPHAIFRAKTWDRATGVRQIDFVDAGYLPVIEKEAGAKLRHCFEEMVRAIMDGCGWKKTPEDIKDARWLLRCGFYLLSAKLFHERGHDHGGIPGFRQLDWGDVPNLFDRVARHYDKRDPKPPRIATNQRLFALRAAADIARRGPRFPHLSAETLGALYEEALLDKETRKRLNIYRTPTYLVDYMVAKVSKWVEELDPQKCRVFEPACGHAPFLSGALRLISDILPSAIARDEERRHEILRKNLHGCDRDTFALDIARLSLTIADIPKGNGWVLEGGDMYRGDRIQKGVEAASVVFCNPPFKDELAATLLRRTVASLQPGGIFGFVLPVNELTGAPCAAIRRQLLDECEIREISVFPDSMFDFASVETGIILGRKLPTKKKRVSGTILFRRVREGKKDGFAERYDSSWQERTTSEWLGSQNGGRFIVPELAALWAACAHLPKLGDTVAGQGFSHRSNFPKCELESETERKGWVEGFSGLEGDPQTHSLPKTLWFNLEDAKILRSRAGRTRGMAQVVMNYAPVDRDAWRIKAFIDNVGRPATSRFLLFRPRSARVSLNVLWALCNSPFANAYAYAQASKRDITVGIMRNMRVPDFASLDLGPLNTAAETYFAAARAFSAEQSKTVVNKCARRTVNKKAAPEDPRQVALGLPGIPTADEIAAKRERLRALHWRVDAEVLKLYALPPEREQELLDFFDKVPRAGVPFVQEKGNEGYIPQNFREVQTLDEYLRITDEWDATNAQRHKLLDQEYAGTISREQSVQLEKLQRLLMLRQRRFAPMSFDRVDALLARMEEAKPRRAK